MKNFESFRQRNPEEFNDIIGKTEDEAIDILKDEGMLMRVMKLDGKHLIGTMDFRFDRVNVEIENGKIKSILGIN